jgi:hypothetical protein
LWDSSDAAEHEQYLRTGLNSEREDEKQAQLKEEVALFKKKGE